MRLFLLVEQFLNPASPVKKPQLIRLHRGTVGTVAGFLHSLHPDFHHKLVFLTDWSLQEGVALNSFERCSLLELFAANKLQIVNKTNCKRHRYPPKYLPGILTSVWKPSVH